MNTPRYLHHRRRHAVCVLVALTMIGTRPAAAAIAGDDPTSSEASKVQVILPVVDGGITISVGPGMPAPPQVDATGSVGTHSSTQPSPSAPVPLPPPAPASSAAPLTPLEPAPTPAAGGMSSSPAPHTDTTSSAPTSIPTWSPLPSAMPTYVTSPPPTPGTTATSPAGETKTSGTSPSGSFLFGVFGHSKDRVERFQHKTNRAVDVLGVFPSRGSWQTIMDPWWLDGAPEGFHGVLDVGVPLWQDDGDLATAATGGDTAQWEALGRTIHERYPGSSVRIGWEFNLGGWHHHATPENVEQWKQAFRHASTALKKGGPSLLVTWNPNKGKGDSLPDASVAWPGDDVVDIVGLDAYDWWPAYSESTWPQHRDEDQGWKYWVDFARTHNKKFAVPEWGVAPGNDHGGGDNPYYMGVVMEFLAEENKRDGIVHSAVYFDEPDAYLANSIGDGQVPLAGEALTKHLSHMPPSGGASTPDRVPTPSGGSGDEHPTPGASSPQSRPTNPPSAVPPPSENSSETADQGTGTEWEASDGHGPVPPR